MGSVSKILVEMEDRARAVLGDELFDRFKSAVKDDVLVHQILWKIAWPEEDDDDQPDEPFVIPRVGDIYQSIDGDRDLFEITEVIVKVRRKVDEGEDEGEYGPVPLHGSQFEELMEPRDE
jgi:hypothetical protein